MVPFLSARTSLGINNARNRGCRLSKEALNLGKYHAAVNTNGNKEVNKVSLYKGNAGE